MRPSSPMKLILGNQYMNEAERVMELKYDKITRFQMKPRPLTGMKHTRASKMAKESISKKLAEWGKPETLFKMKEFESVPAKT